MSNNRMERGVSVPFDRSFAFEYGRADWLTPRVRRIVCRNPGAFTFVGTNSYIVGVGNVAVIDPGPDDVTHLNALMSALSGERVSHILITHTHKDHSGLAYKLQHLTGAPLYARAAHHAAAFGRSSSADFEFKPDRCLAQGDILASAGWTLETITTPGHTANHVCFALHEDQAIFTGDHVMAWSTSLIAPPDGNMQAYMASLAKLGARAEQIYWPAHGGMVRDGSHLCRTHIKHRTLREASILEKLQKDGQQSLDQIVSATYIGLEPALMQAARLSTLAHLQHLITQKKAHATLDVFQTKEALDALFFAL